MTNEQKIKAAQDQLLIDLNEPYQVRYWAKALGIDEKTLKDLARQVGPRADKIREYLNEE